ncbi:MAG: hypothetical protein NZ951_05890 [Dehalococcoidia bacterium]|nr:hypothetical protein [Dehalococcoidia bacterium]MDW8119921.1 hypothetical protein [Chloroflexota bacterium]
MMLWRKEHKIIADEKTLKGGIALPPILAQELLGRPLPFGHKAAAVADQEVAIYTTPDDQTLDILVLTPR